PGHVGSFPTRRSSDLVVFETKSGPVVVKANTVVDCTGDGDIAARAGAPYEVGRAVDGLVQPMTLMFRMGEFERLAFEAYVKENRSEEHTSELQSRENL